MIERRLWFGLLLLAGALLRGAPAAAAETLADAEALAERMVSAIGGRVAWAALRNTVNDSQQNRLAEPTVVRAVITMDFERRRFRIETTAPGLRLVRVVDGERHWRLTREGQVEPIPDAILADDLRWHAGHVYRTLHRVAARDIALTLRTAQGERLEVLEGGRRIAWFALDARGEPYAFGAHDDDVGSICGPWEFEAHGVRHPAWVSRPDGSWRASVKALAVNVPLRDETFAQPAPR